MNWDRTSTITNSQLKEGYKQTEVGIIPEDWETVLLDNVAFRGSGHTPDKKIPEYWNGDIKWISLKDCDLLDKPYIFDTCDKVTKAGIANSSAVIHPCGTVVLSRDAGVGKSSIMSEDMAVSQHFMAWQCGETLNNLFLYYWLQSKKKEFERIAIGNTIKTIGLGYFKQLNIPRPPLPEQEAIACTLSDIDALIESLDRLLTKKRQIKQGAMQELLRSKDGWTVKTLGESCEVITKGTTPTSIGRNFTGSGVNFLKAESISENGHPILSKIAFIDETTHKILKRSQLMDGDLLVSIAGVLGRIGIVDKSLLPANINQALAIVRLGKESDFDRIYLFYYLRSTMIEKQISDINVQAAQANISLQNVSDFQISIPLSISEQIKIANILSDMDAEIESISAKLTKTRQLKQGMMHELLTGRIRLVG